MSLPLVFTMPAEFLTVYPCALLQQWVVSVLYCDTSWAENPAWRMHTSLSFTVCVCVSCDGIDMSV